MRFEKLNDNKIRIFLNITDLEKNNIDMHRFMADPIESQDVFFEMLDKAEKQIGFVTENYNVKLEAVKTIGDNFVLTVTRSNNDNKKPHIRRKTNNIKSSVVIYRFNTFDDFCYYSNYLKSTNNLQLNDIAKNISLYNYNNYYYLVFSNISIIKKAVFLSILEFATYINNAELFKRKLIENGKLIIKDNAIKIAIKYFS